MVEVPTRIAPLGVAELVRRAGQALDRGLGLVWVQGEVAQVSRPASGHLYFTLKDAAAVVSAVMWRTQAIRLKFALEAGQHLRVRGRLGIYDRDGRMQLYVDFAEPAGAGAEAAALEALTRKLGEEGLFADSRKRPLPRLPRRVGVVTSATGAAVRDIARTIERRGPIPILVADCVVQGASAPRQIVAALQLIARTDVDVIIVGRGGGSATDLAAFNDERVVRAVAACPVPVISAVGHEIDLTLCDRVADRRASTPTAAAELAVPVIAELAAALAKEERRLGREVGFVIRAARHTLDQLAGAADQAIAIAQAERRAALAALERRLADRHPQAQLARRRAELAALERRLADRHPRIALAARRAALATLDRRLAARHPGARLTAGRTALAQLRVRLDAAIARRRHDGAAQLGQLAGRLDALSPLRVLDRGYALVSRGDLIVRSSDDVAVGDRIAIRLAQGGVRATVDELGPATPTPAPDAAPAPTRPRRPRAPKAER